MLTGHGQPLTDALLLRKVQLTMLGILRAVDTICSQNAVVYWLDGGTLLGAIRHQGFIPWDDDVDIVMPRTDYERFIQLASSQLPDDLTLELAPEKPEGYSCYAVPCKIRHKHSLIIEIDPSSVADLNRGLFIDVIPIDTFRNDRRGFRTDLFLKRIYRNLSMINDARFPITPALHRIVYKSITLFTPLLRADIPLRWFRRYVQRHVIPARKKLRDTSLVGYGFDVHWTRVFPASEIYPLARADFEGLMLPVPRNPDAVLKIFYGNYQNLPPINERQPKHIRSVILDTRVAKVPQCVPQAPRDTTSS